MVMVNTCLRLILWPTDLLIIMSGVSLKTGMEIYGLRQ